MAEFCNQCADELGFAPTNGIAYDFKQNIPYKEEESFAVLCEGCGITAVNSKGECLGHCYRGHNNTPVRTFE